MFGRFVGADHQAIDRVTHPIAGRGMDGSVRSWVGRWAVTWGSWTDAAGRWRKSAFVGGER